MYQVDKNFSSRTTTKGRDSDEHYKFCSCDNEEPHSTSKEKSEINQLS